MRVNSPFQGPDITLIYYSPAWTTFVLMQIFLSYTLTLGDARFYYRPEVSRLGGCVLPNRCEGDPQGSLYLLHFYFYTTYEYSRLISN